MQVESPTVQDAFQLTALTAYVYVTLIHLLCFSHTHVYVHTPTQDPPPLLTPSPAATAATVSLQHMASERTAKIARFKAQKEMEKKVKVYTPYITCLTVRGIGVA